MSQQQGFGGSGSVDPATFLQVANNLSDVANAATARANLGVAIGSNVQAFDADLQAIAVLAGVSGLLCKTAANTWALRNVVGGGAIAVTNPAGVAGNINLRVTGGGLTWSEAILFTQPMAVNNGYFSLVNAGAFSFATSTAVLGDTIRIVGTGVSPWKINQLAGFSIKIGNQVSTVGVGGSVTSNSADDCIELTYANNGRWIATSYTGTFTVV